MKKIVFLLALLLGINGASAQGCLPEGIIFNTQGQINNFRINYPNCTQIEGDVLISGYNIVNLNGLSSITSIGGSLRIECNEALNSLAGLSSLTYVGGSLFLAGNMVLGELTGLHNISFIGADVQLTNNVALINLVGLHGLTSIQGKLWIEDNDALTSLMGLNNITAISGCVRVISNDVLLSLEGLNNLAWVGGNLSIGGEGHLGGLGNPQLTNLLALFNLTSVDGYIEIGYNTSLTSLTGIDNIGMGSVSGLSVYQNDVLSECEVASVCGYLSAPGSTVFISNNATGCNSIEELTDACLSLPADQFAFTSQPMHVFPNPSVGIIQVELPATGTSGCYSVLDLTGREKLTGSFSGDRFQADLSLLPPGVYLLRVSQEKAVLSIRIIRLK